MSYMVEKGDTISKVTDLLKVSWAELRKSNPDAVGRSSKTGNWFLKQGAVIDAKTSFDAALKQSQKTISAISSEKAVAATSSEKTITTTSPEKATEKDSRGWKEYTIKSGDTLWALATRKFHVNVNDLIEANGIEDPKSLQPGQKLRVPIPSYPEEQTIVASWYGEPYHNRPMANGVIYNMHANTVAHRDLPFGTKMELENPETGQIVEAVVTDRGPFIEGRDLDISYGLAQKLSLVKDGVAPLVMRIKP
ncbi:MAG: LysM peptidoglycan-binding domain-containing protein [Deltaproteobacteria bacterium]|nr:LysM peptidoglycan-binding domain-containing protein [Deltaproteobacteria bacterium]